MRVRKLQSDKCVECNSVGVGVFGREPQCQGPYQLRSNVVIGPQAVGFSAHTQPAVRNFRGRIFRVCLILFACLSLCMHVCSLTTRKQEVRLSPNFQGQLQGAPGMILVQNGGRG